MSANSKLETLRLQIRALEGHRLEANACVLPFADARLNAPLPGRGLALGALHEFCAGGLEGELAPAVTAFAAAVAAEVLRAHDGFLLWAASQADCYAPGLACLGLDPSRIVWICCANEAEVLSVMEEALHSRAVPAVLGEVDALNLKTARRLDAAARQSGATALLLRRPRSKPADASLPGCGAAATRWRVSGVCSGYRHPETGEVSLLRHPGNAKGVIRDLYERKPGDFYDPGYRQAGSGMTRGTETAAEEPGLGRPRFRLDLEYCRNGRTASWIVEVSDGAGFDNAEAGHVRVVAELRDDACPLEEAPAREAERAARAY
ncbi:MAG: ImuA family protein [Rhodomicrobium sp.]